MGAGAAKRLSAVRWGVAGNIVIAWVLTLPAAAAIGGAGLRRVTRSSADGAGPVVVVAACVARRARRGCSARPVAGRTLTAEALRVLAAIELATSAQGACGSSLLAGVLVASPSPLVVLGTAAVGRRARNGPGRGGGPASARSPTIALVACDRRRRAIAQECNHCASAEVTAVLGYSIVRSTRAGAPAAIEYGGRSVVTTELAPITQRSPIVTPLVTTTLRRTTRCRRAGSGPSS